MHTNYVEINSPHPVVASGAIAAVVLTDSEKHINILQAGNASRKDDGSV